MRLKPICESCVQRLDPRFSFTVRIDPVAGKCCHCDTPGEFYYEVKPEVVKRLRDEYIPTAEEEVGQTRQSTLE